MFNILGRREVVQGRVLDLFAGSGAVGIEALSRGAAHAVFVDSAKPALAVTQGNLREMGLAHRATLHAGDAIAFLKRPCAEPFSFIFIDPPYASDLAVRAAQALPRESLTADAVIVIEHDRRNAPPEALGSLVRTDERRYGDTLLSFYEVPAP